MARSTQRMPDLSNATPGAIVDFCAPDQLEYNRLDKLTKYYKTALKARLTDDMKIDPLTYQVKGEKFIANISTEHPLRFSVEKAKELGYLTDEQIQECYVQGSQQTVRFAPNSDYVPSSTSMSTNTSPEAKPVPEVKKSDPVTDALKKSLQEEMENTDE